LDGKLARSGEQRQGAAKTGINAEDAMDDHGRPATTAPASVAHGAFEQARR
jgi:hypothetical protein